MIANPRTKFIAIGPQTTKIMGGGGGGGRHPPPKPKDVKKSPVRLGLSLQGPLTSISFTSNCLKGTECSLCIEI